MEIKKGQKWQHYKGGVYEIIGVGIDSENLEEMVIYKSLYSQEKFPKGTIWVRLKKMWIEEIEWNGNKVTRFKLIEK